MYELPDSVLEIIDGLAATVPQKALQQAVATLNKLYQGYGVRKLGSYEEHIAYLACRLPATFAVNRALLSQLACDRFTSLDVGAGPGTSLLALRQQCAISKATLIERDQHFISLAKQLLAPFAVEVSWIQKEAVEALHSVEMHDLVCASYMLSELPLDAIGEVAGLLWKKCGSHMLLIETGTPKGYAALMEARSKLINIGATIIAPCPHHERCPIGEGDWCHFSERLARTRLHMKLKDAALGYEDEKYSYLVVTKTKLEMKPKPRIVGAPCRRSGHVHLKLCMPSGKLEYQTVSRKDKDAYILAKNANWGDQL